MFNEEENRIRAFVRHREGTATVTGKVHNFSFINQCIKWLVLFPKKAQKYFVDDIRQRKVEGLLIQQTEIGPFSVFQSYTLSGSW